MSGADWIAVDWGTSQLRAWVMQGHEVVAALASDDGMGRLAPQEFESALLRLIGDHLSETQVTRVICCGMVGAAQGWREAPYAAAPCPPLAAQKAVRVDARDPRLQVHILPGIKQLDPADVMRGEETQLAGFLALHPDYRGALCLPGTHSKWVQVADGQIQAFRTVMTGELFALLSSQSVLRHAMGDGWSEDGFTAGAQQAMAAPEMLMADLFSLRAELLLMGAAPAFLRAKLSGLLLSAELAAMCRFWAEAPVVLIGAPKLAQHYQSALQLQGAEAEVADASALTLKGLCAAHDLLNEG